MIKLTLSLRTFWFCLSPIVVSGAVLDIGDRNQVFIDGRFVQDAQGVELKVCPPKKTGEHCWRGKTGAYAQIMEPDGVYRGFYALTKDGRNWRRAKHGALPAKDDILGVRFGGGTVFVDPKAPAESRYKMFSGMRNRISESRDGTKWDVRYENVFPSKARYPAGMDSQNVCFYDPRLGQYTAYVRRNKTYTCPDDMIWYFQRRSQERYGTDNQYGRRTIARAVSDTLAKFPMPQVVLEPDDQDPMFNGCRVMDFYCPQVVPYPYAQDAYFLFNCRYFSYEDWYLPIDMSGFNRGTLTDPADGKRKKIGPYNAGVEDIELDASRDGIRWNRFDRSPWIAQGDEGSFDSRTMYMARGMYRHGDEIWLYYVGLDDPHTGKPEVQDRYTLSRVTLRKDGFTCIEAGYGAGRFTTCPVRFAGNRLTLNIQTSALGLARIGIQDEQGKPINGFALEDCDRVFTANTTARTVTWKGSPDVSALAGRPVRILFELSRHAKLYSFKFGG
jgi:hypothetical protein